MHDRVVGGNLPSVGALAYLGDAYHSLYVRRALVSRGLTRSKDLNAEALRYVTDLIFLDFYVILFDDVSCSLPSLIVNTLIRKEYG